MILIIDCGSTKTMYIEKAVDEFMDYKTIGLFDSNEVDFSLYKGVIISGAPILLTEVKTEKYREATKWIKDLTIPLFGICFGHQIISLTFGGFVSKIKAIRDWEEIGVFADSPLTERLADDFEMMQDHCEVASIPPGFELIGSSDSCVNEIMQNREKDIYSVQFHPEVSGNHGVIFFDNFIRICLKERA